MPITCLSCLNPLVLHIHTSCPFEEDFSLRCRLCGQYPLDIDLVSEGVPPDLVSRLLPWGLECRRLLAYCCGRVGYDLPDETYVRAWHHLVAETDLLLEELRCWIPGVTAEVSALLNPGRGWSSASLLSWRRTQLRRKLLDQFASLSCAVYGCDPERPPQPQFHVSASERERLEETWPGTCELRTLLIATFGAPAEDTDAELHLARLEEAFRVGTTDELRRVALELELLP